MFKIVKKKKKNYSFIFIYLQLFKKEKMWNVKI